MLAERVQTILRSGTGILDSGSAVVSRPGLGGDAYTGAVNVQVVLVHGIRTSATMWRSQVAWLQEHEISGVAVDLPGHGTRMAEEFTLDGALQTIDQAVRDASLRGPVLLVGHSMGGLLSLAYAGGASRPPVTALIAAGCTALPRGAALAAYRFLAGAMDRLPDRGLWIAQQVLTATIPKRRAAISAPGVMPSTPRMWHCAASLLSMWRRRWNESTFRCGSSTDSLTSSALTRQPFAGSRPMPS